jgi:hypothetical protein
MARASSWARSSGLLWLAGNRRCLDNGQGQAAELAAAGHTNTPRQLSLVSRTLVADLEALRAVRSSAIALDIALGASEAIVGGASSGGSSSALADRGSVLGR